MARISFDTFQETESTINNGSSDGIKMFSLKDDGDEAIVRILHNSIEDFDIITTHPVKVGDRRRKASCIRDPREPIDNCPLCKAGYKIQQRFFIHMIQYITNPDGSISAIPCVWERAASEFATKLKTLIDSYGPLTDSLFKIRRNGKAASLDTTYELMYLPNTMFNPEKYPVITDAFKDFDVLGRFVLNKNFDELNAFLVNGEFPKPVKSEQNTNNVSANTSNNGPVVTAPPVYTPPVTYNVPAASGQGVPTTPAAPSGVATPTRPNRYY